jgi:hypothetical protein
MTITSLPDTASMTIEDVQGRADTRRIPINHVVIKAIRHPVRVSEPSGGQQHTIATASMYVNLPEDVKGTHMSRFVQLLNEHDRPIDATNFGAMVTAMVDRLDAEVGHIEMSFPYFVTKLTPVSGMPSTLDSPPTHESVRTPSSQKTSSRSTTARPTPASRRQGRLGRWWARWESNPRPSDYESPALTIELRARTDSTGRSRPLDPCPDTRPWPPPGPPGPRRRNETTRTKVRVVLFAPGVGLEPTTCGLTVRRSAS